MNRICELFAKSQENISTHQKLIQSLRKIYKSIEFKEFLNPFVTCVDILFYRDYKTNKERHTRTLTFVAQFLLDLLAENSDEDTENVLVRAVIDRTLHHIDTVNVNCRYHATQLLEIILKFIRTDIKVSAQLCDDMQDHLIERFITDTVLPIRLLGASALVKLQDIESARCPVVEAYMRMCSDASPVIRKMAVMQLAITYSSQETFIRLMRDMDISVRLQAYKRVSSINPTFLKIIQRQQVIINGIDEEQISIRKTFLNTLLPKWLQIYDNNLLSFYNSLRLDASQNDIEETRIIYNELMKIFFQCFSPREILKYLPIGGDGLIPIPQLTSEVSAYWYYLVLNLQKEENAGIEPESVLPQLTQFCDYIASVLKSKEGNHLEDWQNLQYQEVLHNLFRLVLISDLADEVGRKRLQPLVRETLINVKLEKCVIGELLEIYKVLITNIKQQCEELCAIMSEIQESVHENQEEFVELSDSQRAELSLLKAKVHILEASVDQAVEEKKFTEAEMLHNQIEEVKRKIEEINAKQIIKQPVKDVTIGSETMCRCLDILSTFLKNTPLYKLPSSLRVCLSEFVKPGVQIEDVNVHGKIFLVLGQFCVLDKDIATEDTQYLCSPLIATRYGKYDKNSIMASVQAISDIVRAHGPDILGGDDDDSVSSVQSSKLRRRKLYQEVSPEDIVAHCMNITRGSIMDIILDLLDEEDDDIRHTATMSLMKLVMNGLLVNSSLLTRLMLKWLNPYIEKHDPKMQQVIGNGLLKYAMNVKQSTLVIQRTIVPTLNSIGNAPDNSPFQDVELDHVLFSLCNMMKVQRTDIAGVHKSLALEILRTIKNKPKADSTYILSKMLHVLEPPYQTDENFVLECIEEVDIATQYLADPRVIKVLSKYKDLLNNLHRNNNNTETAQEETIGKETTNEQTLTESRMTDKENVNLEGNNEVLNNSNLTDSPLVNSVIDDSQSSLQSTSSARKRIKRNKQPRSLQVIVERSVEIDRLSALTPVQELTSSPEEETDTGKRKRGRPRGYKNNEISQNPEVNNINDSLQSSIVTRSSRKLKANAAASRDSQSSTTSTSPFVSEKRLTRSSRKPLKPVYHTFSDSSEENTPGSTRRKTKKT